MLNDIATHCRRSALAAALALVATIGAAPVAAQMQTVDPDTAIDGDLAAPGGYDYAQDTAAPSTRYDPPSDDRYADATLDLARESYPAPAELPASGAVEANAQAAAADPSATYAEDDLIGAAEGLFGKGAEGLARIIENILAEQGEPNGYIVGREAGGAFIIGARYGSGTLFHKVEGNMPIYWTGPSIGFDAGANAGNTFVLVYNLLDTEQLYERYPAGEGSAYLLGGFNAGYLRKGNVVLIPIRVGAGLRLGVNAGYMKFSHKQRWLPF